MVKVDGQTVTFEDYNYGETEENELKEDEDYWFINGYKARKQRNKNNLSTIEWDKYGQKLIWVILWQVSLLVLVFFWFSQGTRTIVTATK